MDIYEFERAIKEHLHLKIDSEIEEDMITIHSSIIAENQFPNPMEFVVVIDKDGMITLSMAFDFIKPSLKAYKLLNELNANSDFVYGYFVKSQTQNLLILEQRCFHIHNIENALDLVDMFLGYIISMPFIMYLTPILELVPLERDEDFN